MARCKPTYPPSSSTVIVPNFANFNLASSNPADRFDEVDLATTSTLNNALLLNTNLDSYPRLKSRFDQGQIPNEEFADFIFTNGYSLETINDLFLNDFPVPINIDSVTQLVGAAVEQLNQQLILADPVTGFTQSDIKIDTGSSIIRNQDKTIVPATLVGVGKVSVTDPWRPGADIQDYLESLNDYYDTNLPTAVGGGLCSGFSNPFAKLASLIAAGAGMLAGFGDLKGKVADLLKGVDLSLSGLVSSLAGVLDDLQGKLLGIVDKLKGQLLGKLDNIKQSFGKFLATAGEAAKKLFVHMNKKIEQVKEFFNDFNIAKLKDKLKLTLKLSADQFENAMPAVLNLLGLRACGLAEMIGALMNDPVDKVKKFADDIQLKFQQTASYSAIVRNDAIAAGARRIPVQEREKQRTEAAQNANKKTTRTAPQGSVGSQASIQPGPYVTLDITDEERAWLGTITAEGSSAFTFGGGVVNMGKLATAEYEKTGRNPQWYDPSQNTPDAGWKMVITQHPSLYVALKRVNERMKAEGLMSDKFLFNSCFRSPYYNRHYLRNVRNNKGAAFNSMHMSAMAIDVSTHNMPASSVAKFMQFCSQEGITRMSVYKTFVHVDLNPNRKTSNWTGNTRGRRDIAQAMAIHKQDGFRNG